MGQQADINLSLITLVCHLPPGTRAALLRIPVCEDIFQSAVIFSPLQIQFSERKLSNIKDMNYVCEFLRGQTADRVVDTDGHSPQQVDAIIPVV